MPVVANGQVVLALVRGDDRLDEAKLARRARRARPPAHADEIREAFGAEPGSLGPVGFGGRIVLDETLREGQFVAGANRTGFHLRGVEHGRDFEARDRGHPRSRARATRARAAAARLRFQTAIEVGHIFKLGTFYSVPLDATYLDEQSVERPDRDGELRHRPRPRPRGRRRAASRRAGDRLAPLGRAVRRPRPLAGRRLGRGRGARRVDRGGSSSGAGDEVLLDDRDARPGEKFADADLLGCPFRITVGARSLDDGAVDVRRRRGTGRTRACLTRL